MSEVIVISRINISGVAIGQFKDAIKKGAESSKAEIESKILRGIILGRPVFKYKSGEIIVRYYDINILVNTQGVVINVWRHTKYPTIQINPAYKEHLKRTTSRKDLEVLAVGCMNKAFADGFEVNSKKRFKHQ